VKSTPLVSHWTSSSQIYSVLAFTPSQSRRLKEPAISCARHEVSAIARCQLRFLRTDSSSRLVAFCWRPELLWSQLLFGSCSFGSSLGPLFGTL
jgi:hypothetical protein